VNRDPLLPLPRYPEPYRPPPAPSLGHRLGGWLRRELSPEAFRRSRNERLAAALVLGAAILLLWRGGRLAVGQQAALWGALVLVTAFVSRAGWLKVFGPVLFYDLLRTARQGRTFLLRAAYVVALLAVLFLTYTAYIVRGEVFEEARVGIQEASEFGSKFFLMFLGLQFGAVFVLTPAFTATSIAEEKERRTLDYLLATDLENREIVLGKLASRLLTMLLLLLSGLPVLSFVQFFGGVDPNLVLAGFAATAVTMLSVGSLGILNSVYAPRPRGAVFATYVEIVAYLLLSSCCAPSAVGSGGISPLGWGAAGNIFSAYAVVMGTAAGTGGTTGSAVLFVLGQYVAFHALAAVVLAGAATLKLRVWHREARPKSEREALVRQRMSAPMSGLPVSPLAFRLPRVGDDAILWKELYAEHGYRLPPLARGLLVFAGGVLLLLAAMSYLCGIAVSLASNDPTRYATGWVQVVGTTVSCLMVVAVALRASTALSSERDRQTLDSLLTAPLSNREILGGKWRGALLSVRQAWWCLGAVWLLGFLAGGLHVLSVVLLFAAWWAYAAFAAGLGLWFSLHCRSNLRATAWTLVSLLIAGMAPFLLCGLFAATLLDPRFVGRPVSESDLLATTPPGALVSLAFGWGELYSFDKKLHATGTAIALSVICVCAYGLAAVGLWLGVVARLGPITGRMPESRRPGAGEYSAVNLAEFPAETPPS
jgi:ABC-type transport system involved in multi-copper enzyme maturation permease subunit